LNQKIIIDVAPTGGWGKGDNNPVHPDDIAADVINCAKAGATIVHMHARDEAGELTTDLTAFNKAVKTIKDSCDVILEASTGGLTNFTADERVIPTENPHAQLGSLNIGSLNFGDQVYKNSLVDVRSWIKILAERGVKPSLEIFDTGNLETALHLINEGLVSLPCNFSFVFDIRWGMPFHPMILEYLKGHIPENCIWGAHLIGSTSFSKHLEAAHAGASILRVGFEDSFRYNEKIALNNQELVLALSSELESEGFSIASADEARGILLK
jgi:3-keto-5-aminohexanoate cleavage enzyme